MAFKTTDHRARRVLRMLLAPIAIVVLGVTAIAAANARTGGSEVDAVRDATAQFRDVSAAENAQYGRFLDVNNVACIDLPGTGAMGVHYVNGNLVGDGAINKLAPEALVYQPDGQGRQRLVALEYIVDQAQWLAHNSGPPELFGHKFDLTGSPNRFGLASFYSLHAWVWKHNSAGMFSMWNPAVHCKA